MKTNVEFTIQSCGLMYESTVLTGGSRISSDLRRNALTMYFDCPKVSYQALLPGQQRLSLNVMVPAGSKCVYLSFMMGHQLWRSQSDKKHLSGRATFPRSLRKALFGLPGHELVAYRRGFDGLGGSLAFSSETCRNYLGDLRACGVLDYDTEEVFPRDPGVISYLQAFFIDLRPYRLRAPTHLFVELEFSSGLSPAKTYFVSTFVREMGLSKARGMWQTKVTDG